MRKILKVALLLVFLLPAGDAVCRGLVLTGSQTVYSADETGFVAIRFSPAGSYFFVISSNDRCSIHDGRTGAIQPVSIIINRHIEGSFQHSVDAGGGEAFLACCVDEGVRLLRLQDGTEICTLPFRSDLLRYGPGCVAVSSGGDMVAAADDMGNMVIWKDTGGLWNVLRRFEGRLPLIRAISFTPDGRLVYGGRGRIDVMDLETKEVDSIMVMNDVRSISIDSGGGMIAAGEAAGMIEVWELDGRGKLFEYVLDLPSAGDCAVSVSFSRDGGLLSAAGGGVHRMWLVDRWIDADGYDRYSGTSCVSFDPLRDRFVSGGKGLLRIYRYSWEE